MFEIRAQPLGVYDRVSCIRLESKFGFDMSTKSTCDVWLFARNMSFKTTGMEIMGNIPREFRLTKKYIWNFQIVGWRVFCQRHFRLQFLWANLNQVSVALYLCGYFSMNSNTSFFISSYVNADVIQNVSKYPPVKTRSCLISNALMTYSPYMTPWRRNGIPPSA